MKRGLEISRSGLPFGHLFLQMPDSRWKSVSAKEGRLLELLGQYGLCGRKRGAGLCYLVKNQDSPA